jgi:hypothetical protein
MRRLHRGQALVVMLALLASMIGGLVLVLNAGQLVNDKIRLTNAADAAAYSAALWEARSLNYQAYLNRAIVANEVAIAQLVSLRSWSRYLDTLAGNASKVAQVIPPLAAPMRALAAGWDRVDAALGAGLPVIEGGLSRWNTAVLANAQAVAHVQAPLAAADLVTEVAHANEPRAQVARATQLLQARNGQRWLNNFTRRYERGGADLRRYTRLLMDSRDGFSRGRSANLPEPLPLVSIKRRGGTDLLGEYSWRGMDTLSLHVNLLFSHVETPLGWGAAENRRRAVSRRGEHGGSWRDNPRASRLANAALRPAEVYSGVPEIRDVVNPASTAPRPLTYSVALDLPRESIASVDRLLMPAGIATLEGTPESAAPDYAAGGLHALGTAEVYFQRPASRADARVEYPSLFSPYWQARLVATPLVERQLTASSRGLGADPYAVLP